MTVNSKNDGHNTEETTESDPLAAVKTTTINCNVEQQLPGLETLDAIRGVWSIQSLIVAWIGAVLISFAVSFDTQTVSAFQPYATSSFGAAPLLGTIAIIQSVVSSVMQQPLAKLADVYGRFELFTICIVIVTVGEVMLATSKTLRTYAGAQVFFIIGTLGLRLLLQILAGDSSDLRNRAIMNMVPFAPAVLTTWTASYVTSAVLETTTWRWGYGIFAIIFPVVSLPLLGSLFYNKLKVKKMRSAREHRTSLNHILILKQMDPVGLLLFGAGLSLFLVPISLAASSPDSWHSTHIIAMIVVGGICLIVFVFWETRWAKFPMLSITLLKNRTVMFGMLTMFLDYSALNSYAAYFFTYLVVAARQSVKAATNIFVILSFVAVLGQLGAGILVKYIGRYKWIVTFGIGLKVLGMGLMIRYRDANLYLGKLVGAQIIIGAGEGIANTIQAGMQAAVSQSNMASVTALMITACGVGASVGGAISGGTWTNLLPQKLQTNLPKSLLGQLPAIENSIVAAMGFPWGTSERETINKSFDETFGVLLSIALGLECGALLFTLLLEDFNLKAVDDTREYGGVVVGKSGASAVLKMKFGSTLSAEPPQTKVADEI